MQDNNLYKEVDIRANKIKELKEMGINPYAEKFDEKHTISQARELNDGDKVSGNYVNGRLEGQAIYYRKDSFSSIFCKDLLVNSRFFSGSGNGMAEAHLTASTPQMLSGTPRNTNPQPLRTAAEAVRYGAPV